MNEARGTTVWSWGPGLMLVGACLLTLTATAGLSDWAAQRLLQRAAEGTAGQWARFIEATVPDLDGIMAGAELPQDSRSLLDAARTVGAITRYRLYDGEGRARLGGEPADAIPAATARSVMLTGQPRTEFEAASAEGGASATARVLTPLLKGGRAVGVAEARIDMSDDLRLIQPTRWLLGIAVAALMACGFGIPFLALLRRTREKQAADADILFLARHEPMTGLLNRIRFIEALDEAVAEHRRDGKRLAVLCLDLDGVKAINDSFGHDVGDDLIIDIARRLRAVAGPGALCARLGGDEFAVARMNLGSTAEVEGLAASLLEAATANRSIKGHEVSVSAHLGAVTMPEDGATVLRLMKGAALALKQAQAGAPGSFAVHGEAAKGADPDLATLEESNRDAMGQLDRALALLKSVRQHAAEVGAVEPEAGAGEPRRPTSEATDPVRAAG